MGARWSVERWLFVALWLAYAFFHQGGGWSQNARFAMVRAMAEAGRVSIDDHLLYATAGPPADLQLRRVAIAGGSFERDGKRVALAWTGADGALHAVSPAAAGASELFPVDATASGDLAFHAGHFHPNKAPGTAFVGLPAYLLVLAVERVLGLDPDAWWVLTVNAWLTSALSVAVLAALGGVLLFRLAQRWLGADERTALQVALACGLGTMLWPNATMLHQHDVAAFGLLACAAGLTAQSRPRLGPFAAGLGAGLAVLAEPIAAVPVAMIAAASVVRGARARAWSWLVLGGLGPLVLFCAYNLACFDTPFTTNYRFQNPLFVDESLWLGVFDGFSLDRLGQLLVSPFRGLFFGSPFLLLGAVGLVPLLRARSTRALGVLLLGIPAFYLAFAASFNGWHGGWTAWPRYLTPAVPFLALAAVPIWRRVPRLALALAAVSVAHTALVTAVDPQCPAGVSPGASRPGVPMTQHAPLFDYELPLFRDGRARPLAVAQVEEMLRLGEAELLARGVAPAERAQKLDAFRRRTWATFERGSLELPISLVRGPVSANPVGVYEGHVAAVLGDASLAVDWNSFNAGELVLPHRRLSLLPLALAVGFALWRCARLVRSAPSPFAPGPGSPAPR